VSSILIIELHFVTTNYSLECGKSTNKHLTFEIQVELNKVIRKVRRLGGENGQFGHNRVSQAYNWE
jgi:hypothetical protein